MIWPFRRRKPQVTPAVTTFSWAPGRQPWLPGGTYVGVAAAIAGRVSRDDALSVPAVLRGRNLICSLGALPLVLKDPNRVRQRSPLLDQIDPSTANVVTLAMTLDDLIFEGVSWWQVTAYDWAGFPVEAKHVDVTAVSMSPPPGFPIHSLPSGVFPDGVTWVMGRPVDSKDMIRFDSPNPPLCGPAGARAIRRAIKLAQAGEMYADDPEARAYWTPAEGADPANDDDVRGMLRNYEAARRAGAEAYIPAAVKRNAAEVMSPADLTLAQLQQRSDLEIANLLGIDPEDLGVNTTSRTYANAVDRRVDQVNQTLGPFMRAITDRLSMNDVTRRGWRVVLDLTGYMQADPATRWSTYQTAKAIGVMDAGDIQEREDMPDKTIAQPAPPAAVTPAAPRMPAPAAGPQANAAHLHVVSFAAGADSELAVHFAGVPAGPADLEFRADASRRTVAGLLLPYGAIGENAAGKWRFGTGSVNWDRSQVSRVKLDREHDPAQLLGAATELRGSDLGVFARFKVARGAEGDRALELAEDGALDGMSAVVVVHDYAEDPDNAGVYLVTSATLRRATLTSQPAFADARVTTVAASAAQGGTVHCTICGRDHAPGPCPTQPTVANSAPAGTTPPAPPTAPLGSFTAAVEAFTAAVDRLGGLPAEQAATRPPAGSLQVREPMVYSLNGLGHSFCKDAWDVRNAKYGSQLADDAMARLRKYSEQTAAVAAAQAFANTGNTTDQAALLPTGYRPDLYVGMVPQGRPLFDSFTTRVQLANATPFTVPVWVGSASLSGTNIEGTGPSTGTITNHTYRTVTPTAQSGEFVLTREAMDAANPALDVIALNAMREEYAQDTEAVIATALAAAMDDDTGSGQSTEGCYVYTVTGSGADLAVDGIRKMEGEFSGHRFLAPNRLLAGPTGFSALVRAVDDIGRPLFPFAGPGNALGTVGQASQSLSVDGMNVPNAWSMTSTYLDALLFNSVDALVGESGLLTFRFEEKGGPENIYLNIWGYFVFQMLRYTGFHAVNYTAA